jgi:3-methyladenine DNA glycosylase Mpg
MEFEIGSSHRIGVRKDLEKKLRFFIKGNRFISR